METPKPKRAALRWLPALGIVAVVTTSVLFMAWAASDRALEANVKDLRATADKLRQNPDDVQALSVLLNQLSHRNRMYRVNAAAVLGEAAEGADNVAAAIAPPAVPALAKMLAEGNEYDQRAAAKALTRFGPHAYQALPALRKRLTPSDLDVAWYSADAIRNLGTSAAEALPELTRALKEQVNRCRGYFSPCSRSFIPAIGAIGHRAVNAQADLEVLLDHPDPYLRMAAAVALLQIDEKHPRASAEVIKLLQSDDAEVKERTLTTLKESAFKTDEFLREAQKQ